MTKTKRTSSVNTIIVIITLMMAAKILGLLRDVIISYKIGANSETDAYFMGIYLTINLFLGVGSALSTNLIPRIVRNKSEGKPSTFIDQVLSWVIVITIGISMAYYYAAPTMVRLYSVFSKELTTDQMILATSLTRIMIPTILFVCVTYFLQGVLQANEKFLYPAMMSIPFNLLFFVYLFTLSDRFGIKGLAVVMTLGWLVQLLFLLVPVIKNRLLVFRFDLTIKNVELWHFFLALVPITIVTLTHTFNAMYDNTRASAFGEGSLSAFQYGTMLYRAIVQTTVYGITAVMFPKFNQKYIEENHQGLVQSVINVIRSLFLLLIPMSVGLFILGDQLIKVVFERGMFDAGDTASTITAFIGYTSFMVAFGAVDVLNKGFYTIGNRRIPLMITGLITGLNIIISHILIAQFGFVGIPFGTAIAYYIGAIISMIIFLSGKGDLPIARMLQTLFKTVVSAGIMGLVVYLIKGAFISGEANIGSVIAAIAVSVVGGVVVYALMLLAVREDLVTHNVKTFIEKRRHS